MFDITRLSEYRENNKLEVKAAVGGLPNSLWESYSAFANTDGGIILLGVKEKKDKSFEIVGISDPRNAILLKMFSFLELGERAGSGVPKIVDAMIETFGTKPEYIEKTNPDRIEMIFWLQKEEQANNTESSVKKFGENAESSVKKFGENAKSSVKIIEIMKENPEVTLEEIAIKLQLSKRAVEKQVQKLRELNTITRDGSDRIGRWIVRE